MSKNSTMTLSRGLTQVSAHAEHTAAPDRPLLEYVTNQRPNFLLFCRTAAVFVKTILKADKIREDLRC